MSEFIGAAGDCPGERSDRPAASARASPRLGGIGRIDRVVTEPLLGIYRVSAASPRRGPSRRADILEGSATVRKIDVMRDR
jgi:hypothetical protein